jgi:hypothetical protein
MMIRNFEMPANQFRSETHPTIANPSLARVSFGGSGRAEYKARSTAGASAACELGGGVLAVHPGNPRSEVETRG